MSRTALRASAYLCPLMVKFKGNALGGCFFFASSKPKLNPLLVINFGEKACASCRLSLRKEIRQYKGIICY